MNIITGNLIDLAKTSRFDVILHGCNCFCNMGSGIAKDIRNNFPEACEADYATGYGSIEKLGSWSSHYYKKYNGLNVINAYTQYRYGSGLQANYQAIDLVFRAINLRYAGSDKKIGYPRIGAGLAGGDWDIIKDIIDVNLVDVDHTLVEWNGKKVTQEQAYNTPLF